MSLYTNYNEWLALSKELNTLVDNADEQLKNTIKKLSIEFNIELNSNGLIPDSIRKSKEYIEANRSFKIAFENYRKFNTSSPKNYKLKRYENKLKKRN